MKKALAALLAAFSMILAVPQHASATLDWHHFRAAWLTHRGITLNFPLRHDPSLTLREWRHFSRKTLHRAYGRWQYKLAHPPVVASPKPTQAVEPSHQGGPPPPSGNLHALVCFYGWSCAIASCIINRESRWFTRAFNRRSRAAGWWQWLPMWYRGHFDPFNPYVATAVAWDHYKRWGWRDWSGDGQACGF